MKPESIVTFYPCKNIDETREYYNGVLGLPIYKDIKDCLWFDCGEGYLAFCYYGPERPMASGQCISFNLPSRAHVDKVYKALKDDPHVIGLGQPPMSHPTFPVYSFFLSDPNGYTLEYQKTDI